MHWPSLLAAAVLLSGCSSIPEPATVSSVDLARYAGDWYEIESFPNFFQRGCAGSRAHYAPKSDGTIRVVNTCERHGRTDQVEGSASVVPGSGNAKLKVRFFGLFIGDYWILDLDPSYRWALIGDPNRKYLWILARKPKLDRSVLAKIHSTAKARGFDIRRLRATPSTGSM
jgi:apolipoprotein D and lipocalin family protein